MTKYIFILLFNSFLLSDIFNVPSDQYPTIQSGIDVAQDSDTVLVAQGLYYENLKITRSITLASHAIYDDLTDWNFFNEIFWQWEVTNDNINNTILDGGTATDDFGSAILIYAEEEACITPEIIGFTIRNGEGTYVQRPPLPPDSEEDQEYQRLGGGILFDISNPKVHYNKFINNGSNNVREGGATYGTAIDEDWDYNQTPTNYFDLSSSTMRCDIEEFDLSNNFYNGNDALYGNSFANKGFEDTFDMSESIFDVANCNLEEVSPVWVYVEPEATLDLEEIESNLCAFSGPNAYVDSNIEQECIEDGCGTFNNPFKTITWALQMIMPSESNPVTIHLANGTYSPETGEVFSIIIPSYVSIEGESEAATIIDAQQTGGIVVYGAVEVNISNLTLTEGGFGLYGSAVNMLHCTIIGNSGTGIYIDNNLNNSSEIHNVNLSYITVEENIGDLAGGIYIDSHPIEWYEDEELGFIVPEQPFIYYNYLNHVIIRNNTSYGDSEQDGVGGIWLKGYAYLNHVLISNNNSDMVAGMRIGQLTGAGWDIDYYSGFHHLLKNVTIANNYTLDYQEGVGLSTSRYGPVIVNSSIYNNEVLGYFCDSYYYSYTGCSDCSTCTPPENDFEYMARFFPTIEYSIIEGGWIGEGNINADFANAGCSENYYLSESSPAIDSGVSYYEYNGEMLFDLDESEYFGNAPDMGFYEFEGEDFTDNGGVGDVNADGNVNVVDIVNLIHHILGISILSELGQCNANNLNPDGILNVLDVIALINIILDI